MLKYFLLLFMLFASMPAHAQMATLTRAKYIATLNVISNHKMKDEDLAKDLDKLREVKRFNEELIKMRNKLDNSKPNDAKNRKIMQILEQAGKDIYNELR
jgi:hypothetical protein